MTNCSVLNATTYWGLMGILVAGLLQPASALEQAHTLLRAGDFARAAQRYERIAEDTGQPFRVRQFAGLQVWRMHEEAFTAAEREILFQRGARAGEHLDWLRGIVEDSPYDRARLHALEARLALAHGDGQTAEASARRVLVEDGPFRNDDARSEALWVLYRLAIEREDDQAVGDVRSALRRERAVHPFWAARILPDAWQTIGVPSAAALDAVAATAGRAPLPAEWAALIEQEDTIRVQDAEALQDHLQRLAGLSEDERAGAVLFLPDTADWDFPNTMMTIPSGVVLLGSRGIAGSEGAVLRRSRFRSGNPFIVLHTDAMVAGLRIFGEMERWTPDYDETRASPPGQGVGLAAGHARGRIIHCEIAQFRRDPICTYGSDLYIEQCHLHTFGGYGILNGRISRRTVAVGNRIEWHWQAVGAAASWNSGYSLIGNYIEDVRSPETASFDSSEFFSHGTALGHHGRMPPGYRILVAGNVFDRRREDVFSYRTIAPRNGAEHGIFVHGNWFRRPYLDGHDDRRAEAADVIRRRESGGTETYVSAWLGQKNTDTREMEIRTRHWPGNLFAYGNVFGRDRAQQAAAEFTRPLIRWLQTGLLPTADYHADYDVSRVLQHVGPGTDAAVETAWIVRAFPGRPLRRVRLTFLGPFHRPMESFRDAPDHKHLLFERVLDDVDEFVHEQRFSLEEYSLPPGLYALLLQAEDHAGRPAEKPGFFMIGE